MPKKEKSYIHYSEFDPNKVKCYAPKEYQYEGADGKKGVYKTMSLEYNYGTEDRPSVNDFNVEFDPVKVPYGISRGRDGTFSPTVNLAYSEDDPREKANIDTFAKVYQATRNTIAPYMKSLGHEYYNPNQMGGSYKNIVRRPKNSAGEIVPGKKPSVIVKVKPFTSFVGMDKRTIEHSKLEGASFTIVPVIKFKSVYCGPSLSLQIELRSSIVTQIAMKGDELVQTDTLNKLRQDENLVANFEECMNIIEKKYDQSSQTSDHKPLSNTSNPEEPSSQPSGSGEMDTSSVEGFLGGQTKTYVPSETL